MKFKLLISIALVAANVSFSLASVPGWWFSKKTAKTEVKSENDRTSGQSSYQKFIKKSEKKPGLFTVYKSDNKYYLEIPASVLGKHLMMSSKITSSSSSKVVMAGEMMGQPRAISFVRSNDMILLKDATQEVDIIKGQADIQKSIERNFIDPTIEAFKITERSAKDSSYVIDVTSFMLSTTGDMGVRSSTSMSSPKLTPNASASEIVSVKSFEKNVNFKCRLVFKISDSPYEAVVTRSIIVLPDTAMKARLADPRIGIFTSKRLSFDANQHRSKIYEVLNRWNLQPKPEDVEAYKAGKLVEPAKPIVWYVDDAFPEKLKSYVHQAIEDWRPAFEKIGFKNAIIAKDFPKDDPNFDPEDIRYSCVRYITIPTMNAVGPSWIDPRSGEIIQGSVYIFHDAIRLVHNWMFSQLAAVNPDVRKLVFADSVLGRSMRYIVAHEIGHTLGLMHNFKASACFPVDSLRDAKFTQKYGTTPSIMDYARFNYIAQPGDKGVALTPPLLGEYDNFVIKMAYKPIFEEDEKPTIQKWLEEVKGNKIYEYGPQNNSSLDPSCQSEDLGDDPVKAGKYGIQNAKFILKNLKQWAVENNYELTDLADRYSAVVGQYNYYMDHATTMISGVTMHYADIKDDVKSVEPIPFAKHREALQFVLTETKDLPNWVEIPDITAKIPGLVRTDFTDLQSSNLRSIFSAIPLGMAMNAKIDPTYSGVVLMDDIYNFIWKETIAGKAVDKNTRSMQYIHVKELLSNLNLLSQSQTRSLLFPSRDGLSCSSMETSPVEVSSIMNGSEKFNDVEFRNICYGQLLKIRDLLAAKKNTGDVSTRGQYNYLLQEINKGLQP